MRKFDNVNLLNICQVKFNDDKHTYSSQIQLMKNISMINILNLSLTNQLLLIIRCWEKFVTRIRRLMKSHNKIF